jgi:hypothetical protein
MYVITTAEMGALTARLRTLGAANLALLYIELGEDGSHVLDQAPNITVVQLVGRIGFSIEAMIKTCDWLTATFISAPENPGIAAIATRMRAQAPLLTANPVDALWIEAEPMVNRTDLRNFLRDICDFDVNHGVIYVAGGTASGRTHSKHLIRHVAGYHKIPCHIADFRIETETRTLSYLFDHMKSAYRLATLNKPESEGFTPGDRASRYANRLRTVLQSTPLEAPKPWVVIDFTDEVVDPAIAEFIRLHCADRLNADFINSTIFILGPSSLLESLRGIPSLMIEVLGRLTPSEIETAARSINLRGTTPLDAGDLSTRVNGIIDMVSLLPEAQQNAEIRNLLLDLRREVYTR